MSLTNVNIRCEEENAKKSVVCGGSSSLAAARYSFDDFCNTRALLFDDARRQARDDGGSAYALPFFFRYIKNVSLFFVPIRAPFLSHFKRIISKRKHARTHSSSIRNSMKPTPTRRGRRSPSPPRRRRRKSSSSSPKDRRRRQSEEDDAADSEEENGMRSKRRRLRETKTLDEEGEIIIVAAKKEEKETKKREEKSAKNTPRNNGGGRSGGAYVPPFKLAQMMRDNNTVRDASSPEYQRIAWEALKKSINGLVNKINASNVKNIVPELFSENVVRGKGLFARSVMKSQMASPQFSPVFAALVAVTNTKFPELGELVVKRVVLQFRRAFRRNDKSVCVAATKFLASLVNQQVCRSFFSFLFSSRGSSIHARARIVE